MTSLVVLASCLPSPFWYVFLLLLFPLISHHLHSCTLVTLKWNICVRRALLPVLLLIPLVFIGRSMPMTLMALLGSALLAAIQMSLATPFLKAQGRWVLLHPCSLSFLLLHPNTCSNNLSFKIQPTVQEHEELVWPTGNLKLELTKYSRQPWWRGCQWWWWRWWWWWWCWRFRVYSEPSAEKEALPMILQKDIQIDIDTA